MGPWAWVKGLFRRHIVRGLNTAERMRRAQVYARTRNDKPRLVAQGDSLFCYPLPNPVDTLRHLHKDFAVKTLAGGGRTTCDMTAPHLLKRFASTVRAERPAAVLLSGGGVDLLNIMNARPNRPMGQGKAFAASKTGDFLNQKDIGRVISEVTDNLVLLANTALNAGADRVLLVSYDYMSLEKHGTVSGSMDMVGVPAVEKQALANALLDQLFAAQKTATDQVAGFSFLSMKGVTGPAANWHDEAHPGTVGYSAIAAKVTAVLAEAK